MLKSRRQREILRLIDSRELHTHAQLVTALAACGFSVSQGTLSRDLRQLGIVKTANGYAAPKGLHLEEVSKSALARRLGQFLVSVDVAQNLVILRTEPGGANALAQGLDAASLPGIIGTLAGDDTIFVATSDERTAGRLRTTLENL